MSSGNNHKPSSGRADQREHKIRFLSVLRSMPVPSSLLYGIQIYTVAANGKTQPAILTLSLDRFTAYIRRDVSKGRHHRSGSGSGGVLSALGFRDKQHKDERSVDIGEVYRIQRGQSTQKFELAKKHVKLDKLEVVLRRADLQRTPSFSSSSSVTTAAAAIEKLDPSLSFSIIFRGAHTVDLMAQTELERDMICDTLDGILQAYQTAKNRVSTDVLLLRYVWLDVDKEKKGYVTASQMGKVLQAINFNMKQKDVATAYERFCKVLSLPRSVRRQGLSFELAATFLHKIKRDSWIIKPINVLWDDLFGAVMNNNMPRTTVSDKTFLEQFLHGKQGQTNATLADVGVIFERLHEMEFAHTGNENVDAHRINKDQFEAYLLASENKAFNPDQERLNEHDMDRPLSEYFINSSHNTYLIGDQYKSQSSVQMYSNALYRGARCLELDIWDGGKSSNGRPMPVVWHGGTLTTKIRFVDIIKTIKVFLNFHPDTYPIILSLENHCSLSYQEEMAQQLTKILGSSLYVPTEASLFGQLPSPNQLRGMVVLKGRRPDGTGAEMYDSEDESDTEEGTSHSSMAEFTAEIQEARAKVVKHGVAPELASLTLFHGHKIRSFDVSRRTPTYYMHSFSESKVKSRCRHKQGADWITFNQTHMSRTYPAGSRMDSSNYNPLLAWSVGCQMVALNFQTQDAFLRLNDGRFRENGNCGYVPKPSTLMLKENMGQIHTPLKLCIRVLSGSCLPKPNGARESECIDPCVKVVVYDAKIEGKESASQYVTASVATNGYFPIWGQEKFKFVVENWSVAMLQVSVFDKIKEEFIASSSIPIQCLRKGIRCVELYDATNTRSGAFDFGSLLLDIKIEKAAGEV